MNQWAQTICIFTKYVICTKIIIVNNPYTDKDFWNLIQNFQTLSKFTSDFFILISEFAIPNSEFCQYFFKVLY